MEAPSDLSHNFHSKIFLAFFSSFLLSLPCEGKNCKFHGLKFDIDWKIPSIWFFISRLIWFLFSKAYLGAQHLASHLWDTKTQTHSGGTGALWKGKKKKERIAYSTTRGYHAKSDLEYYLRPGDSNVCRPSYYLRLNKKAHCSDTGSRHFLLPYRFMKCTNSFFFLSLTLSLHSKIFGVRWKIWTSFFHPMKVCCCKWILNYCNYPF